MLARASGPDTMLHPVERAVRSAVRGQRLVLAVSGGRDSMALLHAAARAAPESVVMVATFDHGTGVAATRASRLVAREAARLGFPAVMGHAARVGTSEAEWRAARLAFLDEVAGCCGARVATAHTRDDQVETVLMRVLRDAGPRGLAGLYAAGGPRDPLRPLLGLARADVAAYAETAGVPWVEDPTNMSVRYLRNRVRRDLLPALKRAAPGFDRQVLAIAHTAADWRRRVDELVATSIPVRPRRGGIDVPAALFAGLSQRELAVVWPAVTARAGLRLDRRGTRRLAAFAATGRVGGRIPLSGGWLVARSRDAFEIRRASSLALPEGKRLSDNTVFDAWIFERVPGRRLRARDTWVARLPEGVPLVVRRWRPGDRMRTAPGAPLRRVKRFLRDAHVSGTLRERWPVVVAGGEVVWIPGVRRGQSAAARSGRSGVPFRCELRDG